MELSELLLPHDGLEVLKYLSELKGIPLLIFGRKRQLVILTPSHQKDFILMEPVHEYDIVLKPTLHILLFHHVCKINKLLCKHIIQELLQCLILLLSQWLLHAGSHKAIIRDPTSSTYLLNIRVSLSHSLAILGVHIRLWQQIACE
jgi:hypothetical protein